MRRATQGEVREGHEDGLVLLVEDSPDDAYAFRRAMKSLHPNCQIRVASTGEQAMAWIEDGLQPDVVVCDINLPGASGLEMLSRLRGSKGRVLPLVAITSSRMRRDRHLSREAGADLFLRKPDRLADWAGIARQVCQLVFPVEAESGVVT